MTQQDLYSYINGQEACASDRFGAHLEGDSCHFQVYVPDARSVRVIGSFNGWGGNSYLQNMGNGIFSGTVHGTGCNAMYKYQVTGSDGRVYDMSDPFSFDMEPAPGSASRLLDMDSFTWYDEGWLRQRSSCVGDDLPLLIGHADLAAAATAGGKDFSLPLYAQQLCAYAKQFGLTHIRLSGVIGCGSGASLFCPDNRYGSMFDMMQLIDMLHRAKVGVICDFSLDGYDPASGITRSLLTSVFTFWAGRCHTDGAVLHLSGQPDEAAMALIRHISGTVKIRHSGFLMIGALPDDASESACSCFDLVLDSTASRDMEEYLKKQDDGLSSVHSLPVEGMNRAVGRKKILTLPACADNARMAAAALWLLSAPGAKQIPLGAASLSSAAAVLPFYLNCPAFWQKAYSDTGFSWLEAGNAGQSILILLRRASSEKDCSVVLINFKNISYEQYGIGFPTAGPCGVTSFSSSGLTFSRTEAMDGSLHGQNYHTAVSVPACGGCVIRHLPV